MDDKGASYAALLGLLGLAAKRSVSFDRCINHAILP